MTLRWTSRSAAITKSTVVAAIGRVMLLAAISRGMLDKPGSAPAK